MSSLPGAICQRQKLNTKCVVVLPDVRPEPIAAEWRQRGYFDGTGLANLGNQHCKGSITKVASGCMTYIFQLSKVLEFETYLLFLFAEKKVYESMYLHAQ